MTIDNNYVTGIGNAIISRHHPCNALPVLRARRSYRNVYSAVISAMAEAKKLLAIFATTDNSNCNSKCCINTLYACSYTVFKQLFIHDNINAGRFIITLCM